MQKTVDLSQYDNSEYDSGGTIKKVLWYFISIVFFNTMLPFPSFFKVKLLRIFGAKIGIGVVIKPAVYIKYPWFLEIGNHCWIGEKVWIDNLVKVAIGHHVTLSQGSYLLTGSHDYKKTSFDLMLGEIILEDGVWIGAKAIVCPKVKCNSHSVLAVASIATQNMDSYKIYQGNPAKVKRERVVL